MDLARIEPALAALAATLTDVEASCCVWQNAVRPRHNGRLVTLSWVSSVGVGVDETKWAYAANANPLLEMTPTIEGPRFAVLQVAVESLDQRPGYTARHLAERARTRLQWPSSLAALKAVDLALAGVGNVTMADYPVDGRMVSRCLMEVRLNGKAREADAAGRTSYIATVQVAATIARPDGTSVDVDLQPTGTYP